MASDRVSKDSRGRGNRSESSILWHRYFSPFVDLLADDELAGPVEDEGGPEEEPDEGDGEAEDGGVGDAGGGEGEGEGKGGQGEGDFGSGPDADGFYGLAGFEAHAVTGSDEPPGHSDEDEGGDEGAGDFPGGEFPEAELVHGIATAGNEDYLHRDRKDGDKNFEPAAADAGEADDFGPGFFGGGEEGFPGIFDGGGFCSSFHDAGDFFSTSRAIRGIGGDDALAEIAAMGGVSTGGDVEVVFADRGFDCGGGQGCRGFDVDVHGSFLKIGAVYLVYCLVVAGLMIIPSSLIPRSGLI